MMSLREDLANELPSFYLAGPLNAFYPRPELCIKVTTSTNRSFKFSAGLDALTRDCH